MRRSLLLCAALTLAIATSTPVEGPARAETRVDPKTVPIVRPGPILESTIGMEGEYFLRHAGPALEAKPFTENAPVVVRIVDATEAPAATHKGMSGNNPDAKIYELRYVGTRAGAFDLRDYLTFVDGKPATNLEPIKITVHELLPADYAGGLEELAAAPPPKAWSYRRMATVACAVWLLPALAFVVARVLHRKKHAPPAAKQVLTTEEELRALIDVVLAGGLDTAKQARLEELLLRFWRESLDAGKVPTMDLIARLKHDPRAAPLIAQLETWLYRRPESATVDVEKLLTPYREARPAAGGGRSGR